MPYRNRVVIFFMFAALSLFAGTRVNAQDKGVGLGVILGEPTGFSFKGWLSQTTALDGALAWAFEREGSFHVHADYLIHTFHEFRTEHQIPLYYGIGGRIKAANHDDTRVGVRGVVGVDFMFDTAPLDIFVEVAPIMDLTPSTELSFNGGIGIRYFFQ